MDVLQRLNEQWDVPVSVTALPKLVLLDEIPTHSLRLLLDEDDLFLSLLKKRFS